MKTRSIWIICLAVILVCFLAARCHGQDIKQAAGNFLNAPTYPTGLPFRQALQLNSGTQQVVFRALTIAQTLVTNVVWTDNQRGSLWGQPYTLEVYPVQKPYEPYQAATAKTETTTVKEITTIEFELDGHRKIVEEKVLIRTAKVFKLIQEWEKVSDGPVELSPTRIFYMTNMSSTYYPTNVLIR